MLLKKIKQKLTENSPLNAVSYRFALPVVEVEQFYNGDEYSICPRCGNSLDREYIKFCECCGQHLAWELLDYAKVVYAPREY